MNAWIIAAVLIGLLVIAGVSFAGISAAQESKQISCKSCGGKCTAERNCGLESCAATAGKGCNCGR
ncbi:MAG: hypothetical protein V1886_01515 [archaeon]